MKTSNKKGFTLVELVIVIAVIAVLAAVLIPTFTNVIKNAHKTAAEQEGIKLHAAIVAEDSDFASWCEEKETKGKIQAHYPVHLEVQGYDKTFDEFFVGKLKVGTEDEATYSVTDGDVWMIAIKSGGYVVLINAQGVVELRSANHISEVVDGAEMENNSEE